jgi:hypothetical protein
MMAMPDPEKARLLIEKGADVNARSKTRYSAALVGALYPNGGPALELLFARGAQLRLPKGQGGPLFNATGMALAAISGNASLVPLFAAKGDKPTEKFLSLGIFLGLPAFTPVQSGDVETTKALLDAGLPVDSADDDQLTLLDWAVLANRPGTARLLIARGADVNHVDRYGMTPLKHAASIDFSDPAIPEMLRNAGAR